MSGELKSLSEEVFTDSPKSLLKAQGLVHVFRLLNCAVVLNLKYLSAEDTREFLKIVKDLGISANDLDSAKYFVCNRHVQDYEWYEETEKLSVPILEEMAVVVYTLKRWRRYKAVFAEDYLQELLDDIMRARRYKLDKEFEFTQENIDRLLKLNAELVKMHCLAREELRAQYENLLKRLENKDTFYNIEAHITPYIDCPECAEDTLEGVLLDHLEDHMILRFDARTLNNEDELNRFSSADVARFIFSVWGEHEKLKDLKCMHELLTHFHDCLSFPDLLKINHFWIEVSVKYQRDNVEFKQDAKT